MQSAYGNYYLITYSVNQISLICIKTVIFPPDVAHEIQHESFFTATNYHKQLHLITEQA